MIHPSTVDPRPRAEQGPDGRFRVAGVRCPSCDEVAAFDRPRCPACRSAVEPASFGPDGTVWSSTVVRIPVPGRPPPYALAHVDLDDALAADAVRDAFADAGTDDVDAVRVGTVFGPPGVAQRVLRAMGVTGIPVVTVENACACGTTAFAEAHEAVQVQGARLGLVETMGGGVSVLGGNSCVVAVLEAP